MGFFKGLGLKKLTVCFGIILSSVNQAGSPPSDASAASPRPLASTPARIPRKAPSHSPASEGLGVVFESEPRADGGVVFKIKGLPADKILEISIPRSSSSTAGSVPLHMSFDASDAKGAKTGLFDVDYDGKSVTYSSSNIISGSF